MNRSRRVFRAMVALVLLLTGGGFTVPPVRADTSATVSVTASIGVEPSVAVSVCDDTAEFGSGLTNDGATPSGAEAGVSATEPGTDNGQGVFYQWSAQCDPGFHLEGNVDLSFGYCATQNSGASASPDVNLAQQDLRWYFVGFDTYAQWLVNSYVLADCSSSNFGFFFDVSELPFDQTLWLGLRIDDGDANGDFSSVITFNVAPA